MSVLGAVVLERGATGTSDKAAVPIKLWSIEAVQAAHQSLLFVPVRL